MSVTTGSESETSETAESEAEKSETETTETAEAETGDSGTEWPETEELEPEVALVAAPQLVTGAVCPRAAMGAAKCSPRQGNPDSGAYARLAHFALPVRSS